MRPLHGKRVQGISGREEVRAGDQIWDRDIYLVEETFAVVGPAYAGEFREADLFGQSAIVVRGAGPTLFLHKRGSRRSNVDGEEIRTLCES